MTQKTVLAVDLGAESGRVMAVHYGGSTLRVEELHRFPNTTVMVRGTLYWDVLRLWRDIQAGIAKGMALRPASIGVDTWGVDFALLDAQGDLIGNPVHYRDRRTDGMLEQVTARVGKEAIFAQTGIQFMPINTLYQLVSLVERQLLHTGGGVEAVFAEASGDPRQDAVGAPVAVVHRVAQQRTAGVEQPVVHRPGVHTDAGNRTGGPQPFQHTAVERQDVPVQGAAEAYRLVREPVDLGDVECAAAGATADDPAARRTEVDRGDGDVGGHRRKAAATPASTGTLSPVVCDRSPPVSANTALAMCAGSTSRLSRVRWA